MLHEFDWIRSSIIFIVISMIAVMGWTAFQISSAISANQEEYQQQHDKFLRCIEDEYTVRLDWTELSDVDIELIANNFNYYVATFDDTNKCVAVTKRTVGITNAPVILTILH